MYELVITVGCEFKNYKVLKSGTYSEICSETSEFNSTDDIRKKYSSVIDEYIEEKNTDGKIVVLKHINENYPYDVIPYRVIYRSDKKIFDKLLVIPDKKDDIFLEWVNFWNCLKNGIRFKKTDNKANDDNILNKKIDVKCNKFNSCSKQFNLILKKLSPWIQNNFYPNGNRFIYVILPEFKREIKSNDNIYYQFVSIVLKAYECYKSIYNLHNLDNKKLFHRYNKLVNYNKNKISKKMSLQQTNIISDYNYEDMEIIDELGIYDEQNSCMHSKEYLAIKTAIDTQNISSIKNFVELYGLSGLTEDELQEIKSLIKKKEYKKK